MGDIMAQLRRKCKTNQGPEVVRLLKESGVRVVDTVKVVRIDPTMATAAHGCGSEEQEDVENIESAAWAKLQRKLQRPSAGWLRLMPLRSVNKVDAQPVMLDIEGAAKPGRHGLLSMPASAVPAHRDRRDCQSPSPPFYLGGCLQPKRLP